MRLFYVVRQVFGRWEVSFCENGSCFIYQGRDEAVQVATGAAKQHWETHHRPSGVRLETQDGAQELLLFGTVDASGEAPTP